MSKKQMGFTLIEIVMVLVLLGILSAVAVPKYFDLQEQALQNAAKATVAEYQARLNARFASELLAGNTCDKAVEAAKDGTNGLVYKSALMADSFGSWTIKSVTVNEKDSTLADVVVTYQKQDYPGTNASADQKKQFQVTIPQCYTSTVDSASGS